MISVAEPRRVPESAGLSRASIIVVAATLVLLAALTVHRLRPDRADPLFELTGATMGTTYSVKVDARLTAPDRDRIRGAFRDRPR